MEGLWQPTQRTHAVILDGAANGRGRTVTSTRTGPRIWCSGEDIPERALEELDSASVLASLDSAEPTAHPQNRAPARASYRRN